MEPVFIVSGPRSGTTWLVRALNAHPEVFATETRPFGGHMDLVQDGNASRPRLRITMDAYVEALLRHHAWDVWEESYERARDDVLGELYMTLARHGLQRSGKRVFVDKVTPYLGTGDATVRSIARLFPGARIVRLVRDGRDVAVSGVLHWLGKQMAGQQLLPEQERRRAFFSGQSAVPLYRLFADDELIEWARLWRGPLEALRTHQERVRLLTVTYENMSADIARELGRILTFLGVSPGPGEIQCCVAASTFERMSGGRPLGTDAPGAHVRKGVVGDWRMYFTARDGSLFAREAGAELRAFGYEADPAWNERLPANLALSH